MQPNIYRILPTVNQVIYTLDTILELNIMILAQVVLQIFCWQIYNGKVEKESKKVHNSATTSPTKN